MLIERSVHPDYLSNAYLVADEPGGVAVFVDTGAPMAPLREKILEWRVIPTHIMRTHSHYDHVEHEESLGLPVMREAIRTGMMDVRSYETPGHSSDHFSYVIGGEWLFTGDVLFRDSIGGGNFEQIRHSVMEVLMKLPHHLVVYPGHAGETTLEREWEENPFVRVWRGVEPEGTERVNVRGMDATLIAWSPDYDGKGKAWVRYTESGRDDIVGGSQVTRL